MQTPELPDLTQHERRALLVAVRHLIHADGEVSPEELYDLVEVGTALGEEGFADALQHSARWMHSRAASLALGASIDRPDVQRILIGILEQVAEGDGLHENERSFIDDLKAAWAHKAQQELHWLKNAHGRVAVHPLGATVVSWIPTDHGEQLFVSPHAVFEPGHAIRGGIPVCWPWFARDRPGPSHGVARSRPWTLDHLDENVLRMVLEDSPETQEHWPHRFKLELEVELTEALTLRLTHHNLDPEPVECWGALHTYLAAERRSKVYFNRKSYHDKLTGQDAVQSGSFDFLEPVDRIYETSKAELGCVQMITDGPTVVVWNPGDGATGIPDLQSPEGFVCVEAAVAGTHRWVLEPATQRTLTMTLTTEAPWN